MSRLRHVDCAGPGWARRWHGRGFVYLDEKGARIRDAATVERLRSLAIPPAWDEVWICPDPLGHLQAVGTDDAGRRQYLYHPRWRSRRDREKFDRMLDFARSLPELRRKAAARLRGHELTRERVLSCAVILLDCGLFRIGNDEYAETNGSFGLTTFERRHLRLGAGRTLLFDYEGKSGKRQIHQIVEPAVYAVMAELKRSRRRDHALLAFREGRHWVTVHSDEVNAFIKELATPASSAKDFRTWHATVLAALALASAEKPAGSADRRRTVNAAIREVAEALGNTPAVCRASYIDPRVLDLYQAGTTIRPPAKGRSAERAVIRLLERAGR